MMYHTSSSDYSGNGQAASPLQHVPCVTCNTGYGSQGLMVLKALRRGPPALGARALCGHFRPCDPPLVCVFVN